MELLRGNIDFIHLSLKADDCAISTVVLYELEYGIARAPAQHRHRLRENLDAFKACVAVMDYDSAAAEETGLIRAWLEARGEGIGHYDTMIAGQAKAGKMILVTDNVNEFKRVPQLKVLPLR